MPFLNIIFSLVIWGVIYFVARWAQKEINPPEPWNKIITVLLVLGAVYIIIGLFTGYVAPFYWLKLK